MVPEVSWAAVGRQMAAKTALEAILGALGQVLAPLWAVLAQEVPGGGAALVEGGQVEIVSANADTRRPREAGTQL